jgi:methylmalonyl-CoA mutase N-terminal domain/subunit
MAAVLGGTQSLHTNSYDEALCLPTEEAALLALRTQQVVAHESGVADIVDALGGSYAVEALTDEIETRASAVIAQIDALGGMVPAIEAGYPQRAIEDAAYQYQREIEQRHRVIVGVNEFIESDSQPVETLKVDPAIEREQQERLTAFKSARDSEKTSALLQAIDSAAAEERNLMPSVVDGVLGGVTLGEISQVLRIRYGTYRP